jgi:hypothetical protein
VATVELYSPLPAEEDALSVLAASPTLSLISQLLQQGPGIWNAPTFAAQVAAAAQLAAVDSVEQVHARTAQLSLLVYLLHTLFFKIAWQGSYFDRTCRRV